MGCTYESKRTWYRASRNSFSSCRDIMRFLTLGLLSTIPAIPINQRALLTISSLLTSNNNE